MNIFFLPENQKTKSVDVLLVSGDAYIDHPSFGIAVIARVLYNAGYTVCIASQPEYYNKEYLKELPEPKLFIGISAGNVDSIVSNYTGNRHRRNKDVYSIDANPYFENGKIKRPDRATITYSSFIKQRFKNIPIVIGGVEASLRRFVHYDYVQQKLRKSILLDSKADILVYSMGEKAVLEIAERLKENKSISGIKGTCIKIKPDELNKYDNNICLPSLEEIKNDKYMLIKATKIIEENMINTERGHNKAENLYQKQGKDIVLSFIPQEPLNREELDAIYNLPYRKDYPEYCHRIPAWNMIKDSITSHRGCYARCSFCAITSHQSPVLISRSKESIIREAKELNKKSFFKKTISDIGGPTANMYGTTCKIGWCKDPHCLYPKVCKNLVIDDKVYIELLKEIKEIKGIKNVFVSSGLRFDLALIKEKETEWLIKNATSGHLKIAPEHIDNKILKLMKKPDNELFIKFIDLFEKIKKKYGLKFFMLPYIILSHPGSDTESAVKLVEFLNRHKLKTKQYQDFTPTPQTLSTAMYYAGKDSHNRKISVPNPSSIKNKQREILSKGLKRKNK